LGRWDDKTHSRASVKLFTGDRPRMFTGGCPVRVTLLAISMIVVVCGCDQNTSNGTFTDVAGVTSTGDLNSQHEIAGSLIRQYVEQADGRHVAVEINTEILRELMARPEADEGLKAFRDPLLAARLFAPHIGMSADAEFSVLERSQQPEEGSGLFIAVVQVTAGDPLVRMRMVSEPDAYDLPTLWVLNDYQR